MKNKITKILSFLLAGMLVFTNLGTSVYLGETYTVNSEESYEYEIIEGGDGEESTVTITGYTGSATSITIPSEIDGMQVTSIGRYAFVGCWELTEIIIPEGVISIVINNVK